jgi:FkbM family methyltransferase
LRRKFDLKARRVRRELNRLARMPRYTCTTSTLLGFELQVPDGASFVSSYNEIFRRELYRFESETTSPYILDVGANIGLSLLYFKRLYPRSIITAFEADPTIFKHLEHNVRSAGYPAINLCHAAVWKEPGTVRFFSEGADAGRIENAGSSGAVVPSVALAPYLTKPVDLLKIDIEGAETEVIQSCGTLLAGVKRLFVEYHSFADRTQTLSELLGTLCDAGFRVHLECLNETAHPFVEAGTKPYLGMDLQLNIFAFRPRQSAAA